MVKKPKLAKITARSSSITNAFIQAIIPTKHWNDADEAEALAIFGQSQPGLLCVYCGQKASDWDHLRPLVRDKKPTGYIHEIRNLVPSCGSCNQSKSGADWREWFLSKTANSPSRRGIADNDKRLALIDKFVEWGNVTQLDASEFGSEQDLAQYWSLLSDVQKSLTYAQRFAEELKSRCVHSLK